MTDARILAQLREAYPKDFIVEPGYTKSPAEHLGLEFYAWSFQPELAEGKDLEKKEETGGGGYDEDDTMPCGRSQEKREKERARNLAKHKLAWARKNGKQRFERARKSPPLGIREFMIRDSCNIRQVLD